MNSISVKNYRSISDCSSIEIKPITILVGKNSAGKSSFIRLFPLLKQTVERSISDSLLWYGDYVDLGDYSNSVSRNSPNDPIRISFSLNENRKRYYYYRRPQRNATSFTIDLTILKNCISNYVLSFSDQKIEILMNNDNLQVSINDDSSILSAQNAKGLRRGGSLLPTIYWEKTESNGKFFSVQHGDDLIAKKICQYLFQNSSRKKSSYDDSLYTIDSIDPFQSKEDMLKSFQDINKDKFINKTASNKTFLKYNNLIIAYHLQDIIDIINDSINNDMQLTSYIKPIRANVNRYYRVQGLRVDELDADGSNLPIILYNMSPSERRKFEIWSKEKFGVIFSVKLTEGHISLIIKKDIDSDDSTNVADTGYGYSQMLPIVMLLWMIHKNNGIPTSSYRAKTVVIEQPELHLHPAFQAKMMDVFVSVVREAKRTGINLKIIFETHSETMINRLGALVENNSIAKEDINVLIFDKIGDTTTISSKSFDSNGLLLGWPSDFFAPEEWL